MKENLETVLKEYIELKAKIDPQLHAQFLNQIILIFEGLRCRSQD